MADFTPDWAAAWTTQASAAAIANGDATGLAVAISHDGKWGTEVGVAVTYGGTANEGVKIYVERYVDATNAEVVADDDCWGFEMPYAASTTNRRTFTVDGTSVSKFNIVGSNSSGDTANVTIATRQLDAIVSA